MVRISDVGFFFHVPFFSFLFCWRHAYCYQCKSMYETIKVSSEQSRSQFCAIRHRVPDDQIYCWFIESDPSVFSPHSKAIYFECTRTPWQYCCVAFVYGLDFPTSSVITGMREARLASAHRDEAFLAYRMSTHIIPSRPNQPRVFPSAASKSAESTQSLHKHPSVGHP